MKFSALLLLAAASTTLATSSRDPLMRTCNNFLGKLTFQCPEDKTKGGAKPRRSRVSKCSCQSPEYLASYADCIIQSKNQNQQKGFDTLLRTCGQPGMNPGLTQERIMDIYKNATDYFIDYDSVPMPKGNTRGGGGDKGGKGGKGGKEEKKNILYNPVRIPKKKLDLMNRSWASFYYNMYAGQLYGGILNAYFGFFLIAAMIMNFCKRVFPKQVHAASNIYIVKKFRQYIANPATCNQKHGVPGKWMYIINMSIPTRAQTIVVTGYWILFIIFNFIKYDVFEGSNVTLVRMIGDRTGIMSCAHLPLLFLFAGRNNILLYLTNWSYDTMSCYHRWVARGMYITAFIHSVTFTISYKNSGRYSVFSSPDIVWGIVATVLGAFILFFSLRHFREYTYEFFLLSHQIFVVFFLIGTLYHVLPFGYYEWVWATVGIWAFDRAARLAKIVISGLTSNAECQYYPESDVIKAKINYSEMWGASPGAYVYVYFLKPLWRCWENHPFSVYPSPVPGEEKKLVLCVRGREGWTRYISKFLAKQPNYFAKCPILLEGPYGQHFHLQHNDNILLIGGGIGVTAVYSYVAKLRSQGQSKQITFVWLARSIEYLNFFRDEIESLLQSDDIQVHIYVSQKSNINTPSTDSLSDEKRDSSTPSIDNSSSEEKCGESIISSKVMSCVSYGRPDLSEVIHNTVSDSAGTTGVMVCGPPGMNDDVRKFVTAEMGVSKNVIDLYVEGFNW